MKKVLLFYLLIQSLVCASANLRIEQDNNTCSMDWTKIRMKGNIFKKGTQRSVFIIPIEVIQSTLMIDVLFTAAISNTHIRIIKDETVYYESDLSINTNGETLSIPIQSLESNTYRLEFSTDDGGYVYGDFVIL